MSASTEGPSFESAKIISTSVLRVARSYDTVKQPPLRLNRNASESSNMKSHKGKPMGVARNQKSARKLTARNRKPIYTIATVDRILDSAGLVLSKYGDAGFTTRRVAEAASISLGNLTYHFPSKSDLLRAFVDRLVTDYSRQFDQLLAASDGQTGQEWEGLVRWLLDDTVKEGPVRLFREIWAISLNDRRICSVVDDLYDTLMEKVVQLLMRLHPNADVTELRVQAQLLAVIVEGTSVLYGTRRERAVPFERFVERAITQLVSVAPEGRIFPGVKPKQMRRAKGATTRRSRS
jgi:AcrR family transcriptional regulator